MGSWPSRWLSNAGTPIGSSMANMIRGSDCWMMLGDEATAHFKEVSKLTLEQLANEMGREGYDVKEMLVEDVVKIRMDRAKATREQVAAADRLQEQLVGCNAAERLIAMGADMTFDDEPMEESKYGLVYLQPGGRDDTVRQAEAEDQRRSKLRQAEAEDQRRSKRQRRSKSEPSEPYGKQGGDRPWNRPWMIPSSGPSRKGGSDRPHK